MRRHRIGPPLPRVPVRWDDVLRTWYWKCLRCGTVSRAYTHRYTALRESGEHEMSEACGQTHHNGEPVMAGMTCTPQSRCAGCP